MNDFFRGCIISMLRHHVVVYGKGLKLYIYYIFLFYSKRVLLIIYILLLGDALLIIFLSVFSLSFSPKNAY